MIDPHDAAARRHGGPKGTRRIVLGVIGAFLLVVGWGVVASLLARSDVLRARQVLTDLREDTAPANEIAVHKALNKARGHLADARGRLGRPGPWLAARIPLLGRSVVAVRTTTESALTVVDASRSVLDAAAPDVPLLKEKRLDVVRLSAIRDTVRRAAGDTRAAVDRIERLRTGWTPPQVGDGVREARREFGEAGDGLAKAADLVTALLGLAGADGPRSMLLVLENNAELRGTGGLISVFAEATADRGVVTVGRFRDVEDVADHRDKARRVPAPADYLGLYGTYLANTTLWKNVNMSPDGPTSLGVLASLARLSTGTRPSAILALDVPAIAAILDATGPARLPGGGELTGDNAVRQLLVKAYEGVPDTREGQAERRQRLREAADAVLDRLLSGSSSSVSLATALGRAAAGRHLMLWSDRPAEQALLESAGASGAVRAEGGDIAMVTVQNFGGGAGEGNKLDYYARRAMKVETTVGRSTAATTQTFTLRNESPASGLSTYVSGIERPGSTRNFLTFAFPAGATLREFSRDGTTIGTSVAPERDYRVVTDVVELDPGEAITWTLRYDLPLPSRGYRLRLVPQPVTADAALDVSVRAAEGVRLRVERGDPDRSGDTWSADSTLVARVADDPWWKRAGRAIRRFWSEPVSLG